MTVLTINGKDYLGKGSFAFDRLAGKKYNAADENGQTMGGFMNIYMGLMAKDAQRISAFWDCALEHYEKERPTLRQIEDALEERIENEGAEVLFKEVFAILDESGFYALQRKEFWKNLETLKETGKTAEEKKTNAQMHKMLIETREELLK